MSDERLEVRGWWNEVKIFFLFFSLIFLTLYIPLSFTIYSNSWYNFNSNPQNVLSKNDLNNATSNLINYFEHKENLNILWNEKEKKHMSDVRQIFDFLFIIFILNLINLFIFFKKKLIKKFVKINILVISSFILLLPIFQFFWNNIFHLIMFNNNFWIINPNDISYYLFPLSFFYNSTIFIILISIILNLVVYFKIKDK